MRSYLNRRLILGFFAFIPLTAWCESYRLEIAQRQVTITGKPVEKITVNGTIPGPTLYWREGEEVVVDVVNKLSEPTSIHWHGLLLPGAMDGVPGLNGFPGIAPGETFTYNFKIRQSGTYWYHAHSNSQEQEGHYGSIVITPKERDPIASDRDYVVLLSDFSEESSQSILRKLKTDSAYYNYSQRTIGDFFNDIRRDGFGNATKNALDWGFMRMSPTDLSDVSGYTFLVNGKTPDQNWTALFTPGERVRLRFINASAMSIYDLRIPGLKLTIVAADGQNIEPITVDEFRFGVAETYDVIVEPTEDRAYTIVAEPIDRTGFALATLAPRPGMRGEPPQKRERTLLTMADMGAGHDMHGMDHSKMNHAEMGHPPADPKGSARGWADADTPAGAKALRYSELRYLGTQRDTRPPIRDIIINLGGNMERYVWTINGKKHADSAPIKMSYGERVRLKFVNQTMMAHPMHLHGMFMQLDNGSPPEKMPNKHTVIVPPGGSITTLLTADEPGEWAFHCHLLYHMLSGMMTTALVLEPADTASPNKTTKTEAGAHAH